MSRLMLVTGGAGFIGSHLVEALVKRGDRVRVLDNFSSGTIENLAAIRDRVEVIVGDATDLREVQAAVQGVDVVFHQAALASVPRSLEDPLATHAACATGTLTVLHAARLAGVRRVVYAGSSSAYGDQPGDDKNESMRPDVLSPYGAAKLAGESYCQAFAASYGFEAVVLRYFNVFGPRQDPHSPYSAVIPKFLDLMRRGERPTIFGDGSQSRDFTYVSNVVDANLLAADAPDVAGQVFNVANGDSTDLVTLVARLNELLGTSIEPVFAPPRAGDVKLSRADISRARRQLGYEPRVSFAEGLEKLVNC